MPLVKGFSRDSIGRNIKTEIGSGRPRSQAIAMALSTARRAKLKMASGGMVEDDLVDDDFSEDDPSGPHTELMMEPHPMNYDHLFMDDDFGEAPESDHKPIQEDHPLIKMMKRRRMMFKGGYC